jgi:hypothetical protein
MEKDDDEEKYGEMEVRENEDKRNKRKCMRNSRKMREDKQKKIK